MQKPPLHDLKPDRQDLAPPLPAVMMGLPVLFYLSLVAAIGLGVLFTIQTRKARASEKLEIAAAQNDRKQTEAIKLQQAELDAMQSKAVDVENWIATTDPLMTVIATVINSVKTGNNLTSLKLTRAADQPDQILMQLLINSGGTNQRDATLQKLATVGYQTYRDLTASTDKTKTGKGDITFNTTLVKKKDSEN